MTDRVLNTEITSASSQMYTENTGSGVVEEETRDGSERAPTEDLQSSCRDLTFQRVLSTLRGHLHDDDLRFAGDFTIFNLAHALTGDTINLKQFLVK
ncbi:hypothetical protein Pelo_1456 [Pelomyxa schiedti]|nr:hypothetical protein Pelo_1456 [Pelomyxa schiedti]